MIKYALPFAAVIFATATAVQADNIHGSKKGTLVLQHVQAAPNAEYGSGKDKNAWHVVNAYVGKSASKTSTTQYK